MKGLSIAFLSCMFLGLQPVFSKVLLGFVSPMVLAALTSASAALILVFVLEVRHKMDEITSLNRWNVLVICVISLLGAVFAQLLYVYGLSTSTATNAVLLTRMNSLLIALMGVMFLKEEFSAHQIVGSIIMFAGVAVIATKNFTVTLQPAQGDLFLIATAVCWATSNIIMKKYLCSIPPEVIVIGRHALAAVILTAFTASQIPAQVSLSMLPYLLGLVVLVIVIGQYLWYYALEHTSAANVGLMSLTIPLFGVLYSVSLLGESLQSYQILGGTLVVVGLSAIEIHLSTLKDIECRIRGSIHMPHH